MTMRASGPGAMADGPSGMATSFEKLERELRLLCRGLARSRLSRLVAVSTVVRLPKGITQELALR